MKERPILFSDAMVSAILDGRKTQTRRVVKPQSLVNADGSFNVKAITPSQWRRAQRELPESIGFHYVCPYGKPGDQLYVKEACWIWGKWERNGTTKTGRKKWRFKQTGAPLVQYEKPEKTARRDGSQGWVYRHARFMPRWASRILLENEAVRVERVQDISEADAIAEGATFVYLGLDRWGNQRAGWSMESPHPNNYERCLKTARYAFGNYINKLHGGPNWNCKPEPSLWDANPHVWAIQFKRTTA